LTTSKTVLLNTKVQEQREDPFRFIENSSNNNK